MQRPSTQHCEAGSPARPRRVPIQEPSLARLAVEFLLLRESRMPPWQSGTPWDRAWGRCTSFQRRLTAGRQRRVFPPRGGNVPPPRCRIAIDVSDWRVVPKSSEPVAKQVASPLTARSPMRPAPCQRPIPIDSRARTLGAPEGALRLRVVLAP